MMELILKTKRFFAGLAGFATTFILCLFLTSHLQAKVDQKKRAGSKTPRSFR